MYLERNLHTNLECSLVLANETSWNLVDSLPEVDENLARGGREKRRSGVPTVTEWKNIFQRKSPEVSAWPV